MSGTATIKFDDASPHQSVEIAGEFSDWKRLPLTHQNGTLFSIDIKDLKYLHSYMYKFVVDGVWLLAMDGRPVSNDESGNANHVVTVPLPVLPPPAIVVSEGAANAFAELETKKDEAAAVSEPFKKPAGVPESVSAAELPLPEQPTTSPSLAPAAPTANKTVSAVKSSGDIDEPVLVDSPTVVEKELKEHHNLLKKTSVSAVAAAGASSVTTAPPPPAESTPLVSTPADAYGSLNNEDDISQSSPETLADDASAESHSTRYGAAKPKALAEDEEEEDEDGEGAEDGNKYHPEDEEAEDGPSSSGALSRNTDADPLWIVRFFTIFFGSIGDFFRRLFSFFMESSATHH